MSLAAVAYSLGFVPPPFPTTKKRKKKVRVPDRVRKTQKYKDARAKNNAAARRRRAELRAAREAAKRRLAALEDESRRLTALVDRLETIHDAIVARLPVEVQAAIDLGAAEAEALLDAFDDDGDVGGATG